MISISTQHKCARSHEADEPTRKKGFRSTAARQKVSPEDNPVTHRWSLACDNFHSTLCLEDLVGKVPASLCFKKLTSISVNQHRSNCLHAWWIHIITCPAAHPTSVPFLVHYDEAPAHGPTMLTRLGVWLEEEWLA